jgi:hypothetical protein
LVCRFRIAATRPGEIAQDIRLLAPQVDFVSSMVYASHWGPGEYGVADPVRQPADIVERSVADFTDVVAGSGAANLPWLQAFFSNGVHCGPGGAGSDHRSRGRGGAKGFLLWNSGSVYDPAALTRAP